MSKLNILVIKTVNGGTSEIEESDHYNLHELPVDKLINTTPRKVIGRMLTENPMDMVIYPHCIFERGVPNGFMKIVKKEKWIMRGDLDLEPFAVERGHSFIEEDQLLTAEEIFRVLGLNDTK